MNGEHINMPEHNAFEKFLKVSPDSSLPTRSLAKRHKALTSILTPLSPIGVMGHLFSSCTVTLFQPRSFLSHLGSTLPLSFPNEVEFFAKRAGSYKESLRESLELQIRCEFALISTVGLMITHARTGAREKPPRLFPLLSMLNKVTAQTKFRLIRFFFNLPVAYTGIGLLFIG